MTDLPEPPVPADVDLRDFQFTPIFRARLFGSSFNARVNDSEWRAGVTLWLKSWDQVPAGSLPDDDVDLCRLAELGRDMKTWRKLRPGALHGWFACSDGRLYHKVVAEGVGEAWQRKLAQRDRTQKAREARLSQRLSQKPGASVTEPVTASVTGSKGQGQGQLEEKEEDTPSLRSGAEPRGSAVAEPGAPAPEKPIAELLFGSCLRYLTANGIPDPKARSMIGKWRRDYGDGEVAAAIAEAQKDAASAPIPLVTAILQQRRNAAGARARNGGHDLPFSKSALAHSLFEDQRNDHDGAHAGRNVAALHRSEGNRKRGSGQVIPAGHIRLAGPDEAEHD